MAGLGTTAPAPSTRLVSLDVFRGITLADAWRSFRTAIGLGWAIESNWSDPFLFAVYTLAKPLHGGLEAYNSAFRAGETVIVGEQFPAVDGHR